MVFRSNYLVNSNCSAKNTHLVASIRRRVKYLCKSGKHTHKLALTITIRIIIFKIPVDTRRKLNVHKTFRRRPGRLLNVL